ncbi:hypothetical protein F2P81_019616 [Scophthalmus maximus]|uniref:Uncharacterized protein n=1 Tax=Scophthalmus maximus TaxID=52904 RepID=A0A6A4S7L5_SCOMX|nr:hypothetical protein F2P81_019616 [Scophthalmus maximus]
MIRSRVGADLIDHEPGGMLAWDHSSRSTTLLLTSLSLRVARCRNNNVGDGWAAHTEYDEKLMTFTRAPTSSRDAVPPCRRDPSGTTVNLIYYRCKCLKVEPLTSRHFATVSFRFDFDSKLTKRTTKAWKKEIPNIEK